MTAKRKEFFKMLVIFVMSALIIIMLIGAAFGAYRRWSGDYYFGKIVAMSENGFVLEEAGQKQKTITVTPETVIKKGRHQLMNELEVGTSVIVIGSLGEDGSIRARVVRIIDKKSFLSQ